MKRRMLIGIVLALPMAACAHTYADPYGEEHHHHGHGHYAYSSDKGYERHEQRRDYSTESVGDIVYGDKHVYFTNGLTRRDYYELRAAEVENQYEFIRQRVERERSYMSNYHDGVRRRLSHY